MTNKLFKSILLIGMGAFICLSSPAFAQKLGGTSTAARDYQKKMQSNEEQSVSQETGNLSEGAQEISDAEKALGDATGAAWDSVKKADVSGFFKNTWKAMKADVKNTLVRFKNIGTSGNEMVYTNPSTGKEETYIRTEWGANVSTEGVLKGCSPLGIQIIENRSCIFCPLFAVLYDAANGMAELAFSKLAKDISNVMLVGFALIIVFKGLSFVSSLTKQDAPKFIMEVLILSFKVAICFILLTNPHQVYDYFIVPVLGAGLDFGSAMLFSIGDQFQTCSAALPLTGDEALLPLALYAKLDCFIRSIQGEIAIMQSVGSSLMCVGRHVGAEGVFNMWDFGMVFQGLVIWGFAIMLSLAFAFYLIDATVTLGLVGALMPLLIASWPFKWTTGYTKKGIETFLNTFFVYVFMGVVVSINIQLIGTALDDGSTSTSTAVEGAAKAGAATGGASGTPPAGTTSGEVTGASSGSGAMAGLMDAIQGNNIEDLKNLTDIGFGGFLILLCCCVFGFKFTAQATTLAEKMSGGGISINKIGGNIGGLAASGAMGAAKKVTQPARKAVAAKASDLSNRAGGAIGKRLGIGKNGGKTGGGGASGGDNPPANAPAAGGDNPPANAPAAGGGNQAANAPAAGGDNQAANAPAAGGDNQAANAPAAGGSGSGSGSGGDGDSKSTTTNPNADANLQNYQNDRNSGGGG